MSQSSRIKSMVDWVGQPKGWPVGYSGIATPIQFTTSKRSNFGGDNFK